MSQPLRRLAFVCLALALAVGTGAMGCTQEPKETATLVPTEGPAQEESPTVAFRVELPVTSTPTQPAEPTQPAQPTQPTGAAQATQARTPVPSPTRAPTNTPRPTKTPWPTRAPTSVPAQDSGMVYVPGGDFVFGSSEGKEDESPQQTIHVDGFNIDIRPVACAEYARFVEATGHKPPRDWKDGQIPSGKENHPVVWVSWDDAAAYAKWAGKRLPKEIEWEKAARGTDGRKYPWGDTFDGGKCNSREANLKMTSPVGQFPEGASPYGVLDMAGNVWEWTTDWYEAYRGSVYKLDRFGTTYRVLRGGSWFDGADAVCTTTRNSAKPGFTFSTIGFRCAK